MRLKSDKKFYRVRAWHIKWFSLISNSNKNWCSNYLETLGILCCPNPIIINLNFKVSSIIETFIFFTTHQNINRTTADHSRFNRPVFILIVIVSPLHNSNTAGNTVCSAQQIHCPGYRNLFFKIITNCSINILFRRFFGIWSIFLSCISRIRCTCFISCKTINFFPEFTYFTF